MNLNGSSPLCMIEPKLAFGCSTRAIDRPSLHAAVDDLAVRSNPLLDDAWRHFT